jgi:hypothetical protein
VAPGKRKSRRTLSSTYCASARAIQRAGLNGFELARQKGVIGSKSTFTAKVDELKDLGNLFIEMKGRRETDSPAFTTPTVKHLGAA